MKRNTHRPPKIEELIPQRPPFLFVDRIEEWEPGTFARAVKCVTRNETYLAGHFPGEPVFPGVLLIEALGQTAGIMLRQEDPSEAAGQPSLGVLVRTSIRFRKIVRPGDSVTLEARLKDRIDRLSRVSIRATVNGVVAADGELSVMEIDDGDR